MTRPLPATPRSKLQVRNLCFSILLGIILLRYVGHVAGLSAPLDAPGECEVIFVLAFLQLPKLLN
jgi:hypothetical protein